MMFESRYLLPGKHKYLFGLAVILFIFVICLAFRMVEDKGFDMARREVLLRRIGHELLLQSGDSTSRVLPVAKIAANEYQISFEHELTFQPDSLVNTTKQLLAQDPLTQDYIVNVLHCGKPSVAYAFAISGNKKDDIIACVGREQARACYLINITFKPMGIYTAKNVYFFGGLPLLAFVGLIFLKSAKSPKTAPPKPSTTVFTFGSVLFDAQEQQLTIHKDTIALTLTETRLLLIFALSPNQIIARSRLQKEIWEDEGVIVGRSLDMFISKLRKKLQVDPNIKIVVVRGKGYKIEINA